MVQGIHFRSGNRSVIQHGIPAFPDGGSPQVNAVHPSRESLLEKEVGRQVAHPVLRHHPAHHRRPDKTALDPVAILLQPGPEISQQPFLVDIDAEIQAQQVGSLGGDGQPPAGGEILPQDRRANLLRKPFIGFRVIVLSQDPGCPRRFGRRCVVVHTGDQVILGSALHALGRYSVLGQPVAEMEAKIQKIM